MGKHSADVPVWSAVRGYVPDPDLEPLPVRPATAEDAGCWVDGVSGFYATVRMVELAVDRGWPITPADRAAVDAYKGPGTTGLDVAEIGQDAENFLNDRIAPLGYEFGWSDGDFMLQSESWWCEVFGDRCWCVEPHKTVA